MLPYVCRQKYRKKGTKIVYTSHGFPFYKGNNGKSAALYFFVEKYYSRYTDAIITICDEDYKNAKKMHCKNVFMMKGVGVDVDRFVNINIDRNEYREIIGVGKNDKVVLAIGELNTNKNHQVLIKALSIIDDPSYILLICGRELTEIGKKEELQKLADSLNVRVKFLGFRKDIPEICKCADVGSICSFKEGLGLSGIEMLASGIPVVGSARQGIKDYVIDGKTGYLSDPEKAEQFADAIKKTFILLDNVDCRQNCIDTAKKFNKRQAYDTILNAYNSVM